MLFAVLLLLSVPVFRWLFRKTFTVHKSGAVLVTGASTGIGRHAALALARKGYHVFAGVRKDSDAVSLEKEGLSTLKIDVTNTEHIKAAHADIQSWCSSNNQPFVGLVNNAGVSWSMPIETTPPAKLRRMYDVNFFGLVEVTQAFLPLIRKHKGRIVNVGSVMGIYTIPFHAPYCSSKHAVEGLTHALRKELEPCGVSVSIVEPAAVDTHIAAKSRVTNSDTLAHFSDEQSRVYGPRYQQFLRVRAKIFSKPSPPTVTSDAITHALSDAHPNTRYVVAKVNGLPAWLAMKLLTSLPDRMVDWVVNRKFRA